MIIDVFNSALKNLLNLKTSSLSDLSVHFKLYSLCQKVSRGICYQSNKRFKMNPRRVKGTKRVQI